MRVTEILGFFNPNKDFYKEGSADRGSALHELTVYFQTDTLMLKKIPDELKEAFSQWRKYYIEKIIPPKRTLKETFIETEFNGKHFSGHPDLVYLFRDNTAKIYDWKFGQFQGSHLCQVGFYSLLVKEKFPKVKTFAELVYVTDSKVKPIKINGIQMKRAELYAQNIFGTYQIIKSNYKGIL